MISKINKLYMYMYMHANSFYVDLIATQTYLVQAFLSSIFAVVSCRPVEDLILQCGPHIIAGSTKSPTHHQS